MKIQILLPFLPLLLLAAAAVTAAHQKTIWKKQWITKDFITEGVSSADMNADGHTDLVAGHFWFAGPAFTDAKKFRPGKVYPIAAYVKESFLSWTRDMNDDRRIDIVMVGWPGKEIMLYLNPGSMNGDWESHQIIAEAATESPIFTDLNQDGHEEIVCMARGCFGYYECDPKDKTKPWKFTAVSEVRSKSPYVHGLGVGDINGDGRPDIVEKDGWFAQPEKLPGEWKWHKLSEPSKGGAQMLVYDFDQDGDNDIFTSLDGHGYGLGWYENKRKDRDGAMVWHEILPADASKKGVGGLQFSQLHALTMVDLDRDGRMDCVTGKRFWAHGDKDPGSLDPALTVCFLNRRVNGVLQWEPQIVDEDGGVGCDVLATDLNQDGKPDIAVGNKKGVFILTQ